MTMYVSAKYNWLLLYYPKTVVDRLTNTASALSHITHSPNKRIAWNVQSLYTRPKKPPISHVLGYSKDLRSNLEGPSKRQRIPRPDVHRIAILTQFSPWPSP